MNSAPTFSSDGATVYVSSDDTKLHAVDATTGDLWWTYLTGGPVKSSPTLSSDGATVYVGSTDNKLHALALNELLWRCP